MNEICLKTQGQGTRLDGPSQTHNPMGRSGAEEERRLAGACAEFEAIFVEMLFKSMRASVPESGVLSGGRAEALYTGMLDRQIAL